MGHQKTTPDQDHASQILGNRKALDQQAGRKGPEEIAEIEDGGHPRVSLSLKAKVLDEGVG